MAHCSGVIFVVALCALIQCSATGEGRRRSTARGRKSTTKRSSTPPPPPPPPEEEPKPAEQATTVTGRRRVNRNQARGPRVLKDIQVFHTDPDIAKDNLTVEIIGEDFNHLLGSFIGPSDTPYAGGLFWVELRVPDNYPFAPPKAKFVNRVHHPNVTQDGFISLDILKGSPPWTPALNIAAVLRSIRMLLEMWKVPIGVTTQPSYAKTAEQYTKQYAKKDYKPINPNTPRSAWPFNF